MAGEKTMLPTYDDLAELARICAHKASRCRRAVENGNGVSGASGLVDNG